MEALLKAAGLVALLVIGFKGSIALLPYWWTHDGEGLNVLGGWIGIGGAIIITGLVLSGLQASQKPSKSDDERP